ncbi:MAG: hypothetical protein M1820_006972 [Bogoriella megaspora]|nr:MAG: hypothetical protein M1820_006972 [Bogoriella megaspora]
MRAANRSNRKWTPYGSAGLWHLSTTSDVARNVSGINKWIRESRCRPYNFALRSDGCRNVHVTPCGEIFNLQGLNTIEINEDKTEVTVGTGATCGRVYQNLDPLDLSRESNQFRVERLTTTADLSSYLGRFGVIFDNVVRFEVVLASGEIINVAKDDEKYADLFNALQRGYSNFVVVTRFTFKVFRQGRVWRGTLIHSLETKDQQLQAFFDFANYVNRDPSASVIHSFDFNTKRGACFVNSVVYPEPASEQLPLINPFLTLEPITMNTLRESSLTDLV